MVVMAAMVAMVAMAAMVAVAGTRNEIVTGIGSNGEARRREKSRQWFEGCQKTILKHEKWTLLVDGFPLVSI